MNITLFGTGYVGLVTGACFAEMGNNVLCLDVDDAKVRALKTGQIPIYEPGLEQLVQSNARAGRLTFSTDLEAGVHHAQLLFVAVGTPADEDGSADLQFVLSVAQTIATHMTDHKVIVDKSTVPVGTADQVRKTMSQTLADRKSTLTFDVASNPEFLKEGAAISDFMKPDRIIIGTGNEASRRLLETLYAPFNRNHDRIIHMDVRSAELTKYAANVMLATKISLMNELANLADRLNADIESVRVGIGSDPRIGYSFIYPGAGYGGSCFPKDVKALIHTARQTGHRALLVESVEAVNERQKRILFDKLMTHFDGNIQGRVFALWGLAFKPNTDDMREAPSKILIELLTAEGARVRAYDPAALEEARRLYPDLPALTLCETRDETLTDADGLIVMTEWNEFRSPDFDQVRATLNTALVLDGRNLYDPHYLESLGFSYYGIGRGIYS